MELLDYAEKQERRSELWQAYVAQLPWMSKDDYIPFEQYVARCTGANIDTRPVMEILEEVEEAEKMLEGGYDGSRNL